MPWSPISSVPQSYVQRLLPYSINHRNVTAPQISMTEREMGCFHFTLCFCQGGRSTGGRGEQSYIHTHSSSEHREVSLGDPAQPGFAGEELRHSRKRSRIPSPQVTLHGLQGCHRLHVSTNTQAHSNEERVCLLTFNDTAICLLFKKNSDK